MNCYVPVGLDHFYLMLLLYLPFWLAGKESVCNVIDMSSVPGLGRSPGEGNGYPLQYSGLENSMDCIVHGVTKSQTQLSNFHFYYGWYLPAEYRWPFNLALPYKLNRSARIRMACFSMLNNYNRKGFPGGSVGKESTCNAGDCLQHSRPGLDPWIRKIPWRRKWQPITVFLPGKSHGQRRLTGSMGSQESDMTYRLNQNQNNYMQFWRVKHSDMVSGSTYMHMFSSA